MGLTSKISATFGLSYKENSSFSLDPRMEKQSEELILSPVFPFHLKIKSLSIRTSEEVGSHALKGLCSLLPENSVPES